MSRTRTATIVFLGMIVMTACGPDSSTYTVAYYKAHKDERKVKLEECNNDPGRLRNDPLCVNAHEADFKDSIGDLRSLPPIGLERAAEDYKREQRKRLEAASQRQ